MSQGLSIRPSAQPPGRRRRPSRLCPASGVGACATSSHRVNDVPELTGRPDGHPTSPRAARRCDDGTMARDPDPCTVRRGGRPAGGIRRWRTSVLALALALGLAGAAACVQAAEPLPAAQPVSVPSLDAPQGKAPGRAARALVQGAGGSGISPRGPGDAARLRRAWCTGGRTRPGPARSSTACCRPVCMRWYWIRSRRGGNVGLHPARGHASHHAAAAPSGRTGRAGLAGSTARCRPVADSGLIGWSNGGSTVLSHHQRPPPGGDCPAGARITGGGLLPRLRG